MTLFLELLALAGLILINGFFVAAEYGLVTSRRTRIRELEREGMIPGAFHCPRGMLEFWIDPDSPYYKDVFGSGKEFVFYCNGAWRSALAADTAQQMGLERVVEMDGGFTAWKRAGFPVAERSARKPA